MKILVVMPVTESHKQILAKAAAGADIIYESVSSVTKEQAVDADIIIGNVPPNFLSGNKSLKLLQLNTAGADGYTAPGVLPEQAVLTNATGAYGLAISEHMIAMLLCLMKNLDKYHDSMKSGDWKDEGMVPSIWGSKTLVVGLGDIGNEFARKMNALGSTVSAIKRNASAKPDYIDKMYDTAHLFEALENADIVATCLPGTKETYHMFNAEAFSHMKKGAFFINVGRGTAVDSDALADAVNWEKFGGVGLDVTEPEPLPEDHPLWYLPNVLITPHVSGGYHLAETHNRIVNIAAKNIRHIIKGEPVENVVDMKTGYRKSI